MTMIAVDLYRRYNTRAPAAYQGWRHAILLLVLLMAESAYGFYIPGFSPIDYKNGDSIEVFADRLSSRTEKLPFDYFKLKFCEPEEGRKSDNLNLGEILLGERDDLTAYKINMGKPKACQLLCSKQLTAKDVLQFQRLIRREYYVRMNIDTLPLVMRTHDNVKTVYVNGVPIGANASKGRTVVYNHISFEVHYHIPKFGATDLNFQKNGSPKFFRVVGFFGTPMSINHRNARDLDCSDPEDEHKYYLSDNPDGQKIIFSYDVDFRRSDIQWATRFDQFLNADTQVRSVLWISIINACGITLALASIIATVLLRTVYLDFARYNNIDDAEEAVLETGWKLLHGDVFRPPQLFQVLCIFVGTGAQLFVVTSVLLLFSLLGFFSPAHRGSLLLGLILIMAASSIISGYVSSRLYYSFDGPQKRFVTVGSAVFFPGLTVGTFFALNLLLTLAGSSAAASFLTLLLLMLIAFGVSFPLTILGSYIALRTIPFALPVRTNAVVRPVPESATGWKSRLTVLAGVIPFCTIFVELYYVMNSIWQDSVFVMFGVLALVFLILVVVCVELSVVITYLTLSGEEHRWWWRSFLAPSSSGLYVFLFSIFYVFSQPALQGMHFISMILYFGYMTIISIAFFLVTGVVGFTSSFYFVHKIYSEVRID
ncbi:hypothetical protein NDN08_007903 [Rhodosorus marinus]|uniref:Transmembrane 9 superfamily member n=1 Tax=Rhodosorus marinus TaxID=101924 RepID=A0AAV8UZ75_9RHOD|nr:hypothetical protein NDN08_007903 [Rhodosorus marinus]